MAKTYEPIGTTTLGSAQASYTFSSIPATYTDLILVVAGTTSVDGASLTLRFNSDTATNYSTTVLRGSGTAATSARGSNLTFLYLGYGTGFSSTQISNAIMHIQNYANTTTYKTTISRTNNANGSTGVGTESNVGLWRKTPEAINTIVIAADSGNLGSGMTLTLYGIKAA